jgi:ATP-dependent Clp protease ATP-binding subunit ClpA
VISKHLVDPLALGILEGAYADGDQVLVDARDGELTFSRVPAEAVTA